MRNKVLTSLLIVACLVCLVNVAYLWAQPPAVPANTQNALGINLPYVISQGYSIGADEVISALRAVTCTTIDTGQGANEVFDMDQNVDSTASVIFNDVNVTDELMIDNEAITNWDDLSSYITLGDEGIGFSIDDYTYLITINSTYTEDGDDTHYLVYNQTSNLVYSHDNFTIAAQWTVEAIKPIEGLVHIKAGKYPFAGRINLFNLTNVVFRGDGPGTELIPSNFIFIYIGDEADTSPSFNITFCNMAFNCTQLDSSVQDGWYTGIRMEDSSDNLVVYDTYWFGGKMFTYIYGHEAGGARVYDNYFRDCDATGGIVHPHSPWGIWTCSDNYFNGGFGEAIRHCKIITNNLIENYNSQGQDAIIVTGNKPAICIGNRINGGSGDGIEVWDDYSIVSDNLIMDLATGRGIYTSGTQNDVIISNNFIYLASLAGIETATGDQRITIQGNYFQQCYAEGILCKSDDSVIIDNTFNRQGHLSANTKDVIVLDGADRCLVANNKMVHVNGANSPRYGISVTDSDNCTISDNQIDNALTAGIYITGSTCTLATGNNINTGSPSGGDSIYLTGGANFTACFSNYGHLTFEVNGGSCTNNTFTNNILAGDITDTGTGTRAWENFNPWAGVFITDINFP